MTPSGYSALLFDLDGTLLDYEASSFRAFRETFEALDIHTPMKRFYDEYHAINLKYWQRFENKEISSERLRVDRFRDLIDTSDIIQADPAKISEDYLSSLSCQVDYLPESCEILRRLAGKWKIGILTNGISHVQRGRLARCAFKDLLSAVVISDEHGIAKPDPAVFEIALAELNCGRSEVLFVGDSINSDMAGAANAGIDFCWYNPGDTDLPQHFSPKYIIKSLSELLSLLM